MMCRRLSGWWWLVLWLIPLLAQAGQVTASIDRHNVQLGETVTLNLRIDGAIGGIAMPDLHPLNKDFEILGTSQSSNMSVINGNASSTLTIGIALRPRHMGQLQIPALSVAGDQSQPLQMQVTASDPTAAAATHKNIFMEAQIEPKTAFVGQQLSYVVRLYYAINLSGGALDTPQVDGADVRRVGKDLSYETERSGRNYRVLERRYALIPQRAGQLDVAPLGFQGNAVEQGDWNSFFGGDSPVTASAPAVKVDVRPMPSNWGKSAWLPARNLTLGMDGWPQGTQQARVGQPLNLTMTLQATGLPFETLPELSLPPIDGATAYPDKPVTGTKEDGQWLVGRRQQSFAIVPDRAGMLTIPATTIKWWNVLSDKMEVAQIPARSINVLPGSGTATTPAAPSSSAPAASTQVNHAETPESLMPWRRIALASLGLWLLSLLGWWLWRRRRGSTPARIKPDSARTSVRQYQLAFLAAARGGDSAIQARSLLAWARAERPAIHNLGELSAALDDTTQQSAIAELQRRHYSGAAASDGATLAASFKRGFVWRASGQSDDTSALPPLYPFKLD